jgi:pimeloyl-ACP methyl ester carboxylesterase
MARLALRNWSLVLFAVLSAASAACTNPRSELDASQQSAPDSNPAIVRVPSRDGTLIAIECAGTGPTLILVHGGVGDRTRWTPMFPHLSSHFTVCAMDRRGHGLSGDSAGYSLQKEAEDVASVADSRRGTVFVLGHSYGGVSALEATFLTDRISKLILYEPPVQDPVERNLAVAEKMERMIKSGAREQALVTFETEVVELSASEVAAMKLRPAWPELVATIEMQLRQMRALAAYRFDATRLRAVNQPTLLLIGSVTSSSHLKQAITSLQIALPNAIRVVLEGQQHNAMDSGRELLADAINNFLLDTTHQDPKK